MGRFQAIVSFLAWVDIRIWRNTLVVLNIKPLNIAQYQGSSVVKI